MLLRRLIAYAVAMLAAWGHLSPAQVAAKAASSIGGEQHEDVLENPIQIQVIAGKILVLEPNAPFLKLFDLSGKTIQQFVKKGAGPGELIAPSRFLFDPAARRLYVWDRMNVRANIYALEDTLRFEKSYRTPSGVSDACLLGTRLFVLGFWNGHLIHELQAQGGELRATRSLGVPRANHPLDGNPNFQFQVTIGRIACDALRQQVIAVSSYVGAAQIVDTRSGVQRTVKLDSLRSLEFREKKVGQQIAVAQWVPSTGADYVTNAEAQVGSVRLLAIRLGKDHIGTEGFESETEWFLLPTGTLRRGATTRQREVGKNGPLVVCFLDAPSPKIETYTASRCP